MHFFTSAYEVIVKGGVFMIPLLIAAVAAIILVIERLLFLRENSRWTWLIVLDLVVGCVLMLSSRLVFTHAQLAGSAPIPACGSPKAIRC